MNAIHELRSSRRSHAEITAVDAIAALVAGVDLSLPTTEYAQRASLSVVPNCTTAITGPGVVLAAKEMYKQVDEDVPSKPSIYLKIRRVMITPTRVISCPAGMSSN